jgi:PPM family protein phosphatase
MAMAPALVHAGSPRPYLVAASRRRRITCCHASRRWDGGACGAFLEEVSPSMHLRAGAGSDRGRVRTLNEDAYVLRAGDGLFLVCDGMGGAPAGEVASQMAVAAIERQLHATQAATEADRSEYLPHSRRLAAAVRWSNAFIYDHAQKDPRQSGMGTTVVGAWIQEQVASVAHVGDSRAYLCRGDRLEPLTRDHSLVEAHRAAGLADEETDVPAAHRHALVRVLGREPDVVVDISEVPVQTGDYLLLCSDGLTRMVSEAVMAKAIRDHREPQRICDCLITAANGNGGADNITVVVVEVADRWWRRLVDRWRKPAGRGEDVEAYAAV